MKIKNIIFDVGNVLFEYDPSFIIDSLFPKTENKAFFLDELFNSDIWQQLDRGDLTENKAIHQLTNQFKCSETTEYEMRTLINQFPDYLIPIEENISLFKTLTSQYKLFILSNFQTIPFKRLLEKHPFLKLSNGTVISNDIMMKKPELGIYDYLITTYRLIPNECIFVDDLKENIDAAKKILINGIQFTTPSKLKKDLQKFNILL